MWIAEFSESSNLWTQIAVQVLLDHVCLSVISTSSLHLCWCGLCASREVFASNSVISEMVRVVSRFGYDFSTFDSECIELYATVWQYSLNWGWLYHCLVISVALTLRDLKCDHTCIVDVLVFKPWPQISRDYPLNLSILISGGKETNKDSLSNGEWSGKSSNLKSAAETRLNCSLEMRFPSHEQSSLEEDIIEGENPVWACGEVTMRVRRVGLFGIAVQNGW